MSIRDFEELVALKEVGRIVRLALEAMSERVRPGISTADLAEIGSGVMRQNGARSAPVLVYGFPGDLCISLNDEAVHGIPAASRRVRAGDLVKLDVTFEKDGFMADAAVTVVVEPATDQARDLAACAERAFRQALRYATAGRRLNEVGRAVEEETRRSGFRVIRSLGGHGIGRTIHEPPHVPNYDDPSALTRLTEGLVLTIEPIIASGSAHAVEAEDGWTVKTTDGGLSAHFEHTLVITAGEPLLLTAA
jgi:methionyl aminopeptidase